MKSWQKSYEEILDHHDKMNFTGQPQIHFSESLFEWLGRITVLYGLPFDYLVPDDKMLPMESIRFFYLDPNWICSMIDGALSVNRLTKHDREHDNQLVEWLYARAMEESRKFRPGSVTDEQSGKESDEAQVRTGFLIRSLLVQNWPGVRIKAFSKEETPLALLRVEKLAPDTLLCIVDGVMETVNIIQSGETVHFGIDFKQNKPVVQLRHLQGDNFGDEIEGKDPIPVPTRGDGNDRVVDVKELANRLKAGCKEESSVFTSAEFAVQMIEGVDVCVFKRKE